MSEKAYGFVRELLVDLIEGPDRESKQVHPTPGCPLCGVSADYGAEREASCQHLVGLWNPLCHKIDSFADAIAGATHFVESWGQHIVLEWWFFAE